jgi:hypothetical protein
VAIEPVALKPGIGVAVGIGVGLGLGLGMAVGVGAAVGDPAVEPAEQPAIAMARSRPARPGQFARRCRKTRRR